MIEKSRNIPLSELYQLLQLEYISYFVRSKIYCRDFAENYAKICLRKRAKIENISQRNNLPSIFTDEVMKEKYISKFLNSSGIPNFTYKDQDIRNKMQRWDRHYYFNVGSSISMSREDESVFLGVVTFNDKDDCIVKVKDDNNEIQEFHYNLISRILPDNFFNF